MIRQAISDDLDQVEQCFTELLEYEQTHVAYTAWRLHVYPTRATAEKSLSDGSLYVMERDGEIVGCVIASKNQPEKFHDIAWQYPAQPDEVVVINLLCVRPSRARRGIGTSLVRFVIEAARSANRKAVRLDTGARNAPAIALYTNVGFTFAGSNQQYRFYEFPIFTSEKA